MRITALPQGPVAAAGVQHYPECPCGRCQAIRAPRPVASAIQAKHLSGASISKLVEYEVGLSMVTNEHQWSPAGTLVGVGHYNDKVNLVIDWDAKDETDNEVSADSWVRVTAKVAS